MALETTIAEKLWKALRSDRTIMLGLPGIDDGHAQPMTALFDGDAAAGPLYIFSASGVDLVGQIGDGKPALAHFVSHGHDVFATIHGTLTLDGDRAVVERLWNPFVAAWYDGGKDDPELRLLRFDPDRAQVWLNEHSALAGIKLLLGRDPKKEYKDKVAEVKVG
jgi:general stress protein 26